MKKKKIAIIGHFGYGKNLINGQTAKTIIVSEELTRRYGENEVITFDTHGGIKALFKLPFQIFSAVRKSKNIIILPASRGVRIISPILNFFNAFYKRKIHYVLIGGWLGKLLREKKGLARQLKKFDAIYAETTIAKNELVSLGLENVLVMQNCKKLECLNEAELPRQYEEPYKLCTFSRVMKEKGIEDAVFAVKSVNEELGRTAYVLDIYGPVDENQVDWFENLKLEFPSFISYKGSVQFDKSVEVLKDYFALLFPTRFYTEGVPGTIIDAYAAGVPVISSKWESFSDVVDDGKTGIGYEFSDRGALSRMLLEIASEPQRIVNLKEDCLRKARDFMPESVVDIIDENME